MGVYPCGVIVSSIGEEKELGEKDMLSFLSSAIGPTGPMANPGQTLYRPII